MEELHCWLLCGLNKLYDIVWGFPLMALIFSLGLYLTIALRGIQLRRLVYAIKLITAPASSRAAQGDLNNFAALMMALAATIGTGNIAGVATAFTTGGIGALFWMWVTALIGMPIKYAEALLAIKYRQMDRRGQMCGGPMHFIQWGLGWRFVASSFALLCAIGAFGGGNMLQANSMAAVMGALFDVDALWAGGAIAFFTALSLLGGVKSIGRIASFLVPIMALIYLGAALVILGWHWDHIPGALYTIVSHAFTGEAAIGGFLGATVAQAVQVGISRGVMTSDTGLGTASIIAAAAKSDHPCHQALISMTGSFFATIITCSATGLVIIVTNVLGQVDSNGLLLTGASLTVTAFQTLFLTWGGYIVAFGLLLFGFTTILGWAYYGEKCIEYLMGERAIPFYRLFFTLIAFLGACLQLDIVWKVSDICNGLMAFPNLIALCFLAHIAVAETRNFDIRKCAAMS